MENAETILVIILSVFLALFLLLAVILIIKCLQMVKRLQRITEKAESVVDKAESVGDFLHKASGTFAVNRLVSTIMSAVKHSHGDKQSGRKRK